MHLMFHAGIPLPELMDDGPVWFSIKETLLSGVSKPSTHKRLYVDKYSKALVLCCPYSPTLREYGLLQVMLWVRDRKIMFTTYIGGSKEPPVLYTCIISLLLFTFQQMYIPITMKLRQINNIPHHIIIIIIFIT